MKPGLATSTASIGESEPVSAGVTNELRGQERGELERRALVRPRELHGQVAGEVAVLRVGRALHLDRRSGRHRRAAAAGRRTRWRRPRRAPTRRGPGCAAERGSRGVVLQVSGGGLPQSYRRGRVPGVPGLPGPNGAHTHRFPDVAGRSADGPVESRPSDSTRPRSTFRATIGPGHLGERTFMKATGTEALIHPRPMRLCSGTITCCTRDPARAIALHDDCRGLSSPPSRPWRCSRPAPCRCRPLRSRRSAINTGNPTCADFKVDVRRRPELARDQVRSTG